MLVLILLSILSTAHSNQTSASDYVCQKGRTAVAVKQGIDNYTNSIPPGISDFKQLTLKSKIFIDNTLFCHEVLRRIHHRRYLLSLRSPSQWGKTTLLTMLKTFLEIEVDENGKEILPKESTSNYRLFNNGEIVHADGTVQHLHSPLLIAQERESMKYQGKYPTIYLSFTHATGQNYEQVEQQISLAVHQAFKQHAYMIKRFEDKIKSDPSCWGFARDDAENDLQKFKHYLRATGEIQLKLSNLKDCLEFLNKVLNEYFTRRCYLLIDDYDAPLLSSLYYRQFPKVDEVRLWDQFKEFMTAIAKYSQFENTILMGTFIIPFKELEKLKSEDVLDEYHTNDNQKRWSPFREYFGIKRPHVEYLFEKHNVTDDLAQQAQLWYNGYVLNGLNHHFYHPASTVQFLHHRKIAFFRSDRFADFAQNTIKQYPWQKTILYRIIGKQFVDPSYDERSLFERNRNDNEQIYVHTQPELFHAILWLEQHITATTEEELKRKLIPNVEGAIIISNWLLSYYKQKCRIDDKLLDDAANTFLEFVTTESTPQQLIKSLEQLYKNSVFKIDPEWKNDIEDPAHSIFYSVALRMQHMSNYQLDVYYSNIKATDLVIYDDAQKKAILVELREESSAETAYKLAAKWTKVVKPFNAQTIQLVGINIFADKSVDIYAKNV